jgi:hypothetical protein
VKQLLSHDPHDHSKPCVRLPASAAEITWFIHKQILRHVGVRALLWECCCPTPSCVKPIESNLGDNFPENEVAIVLWASVLVIFFLSCNQAHDFVISTIRYLALQK